MLNIYIIVLKKVAYFAGGCFWCTEAIYQNVKGVEEVISGYIGGSIKNPSYREVCSGRTGHAEAVRVVYDQTLVSFNLLVAIFFFYTRPNHVKPTRSRCWYPIPVSSFLHFWKSKENHLSSYNRIDSAKYIWCSYSYWN